MEAYSRNCRLNGYEDSYDWYLAWEVYKYLHRNEGLLKEARYMDLFNAVEYIFVCHRLSHVSDRSYADMKKFCRFYVSLAKNEDKNNFVLTDEVEGYLLLIAGNRNELLAAKLLEIGEKTRKKAISE